MHIARRTWVALKFDIFPIDGNTCTEQPMAAASQKSSWCSQITHYKFTSGMLILYTFDEKTGALSLTSRTVTFIVAVSVIGGEPPSVAVICGT